MTGAGSIVIGGVAISYPAIAVMGVVLIIAGALLLRTIRPARVTPTSDE